MTEANGTRDNLNSSNSSSAASELPTQPVVSRSEASGREMSSREISGRIERPPLKIISDKGVSKTLSGPGRLSRRDSATQRQRTKGAAKESRRRAMSSKSVAGQSALGRSASDKPHSGRSKRLSGSATSENVRRRSRQSGSRSAALTLTKGAGTRASAKTSARTGAKTSALVSASSGKKPIPPSLSLARRRNVRRKTPVPLLYLGRLAIAGLGIAALGGTLLTVLPNKEAPSAEVTEAALISTATPAAAGFPILLGQEIAPLKSELQALPNLYPNLSAKAFYIDVDTGDYVDLEGGDLIAAASTIKLPILLAFFEEVDKETIDLNRTLTISPEQIAEGSGDMQVSPPGTQFTALEVATQMIIKSDNTATNMMIDLLGGPEALNERFKGYGLQKTQLNNPLPDLTGTNTTSAKDLVHTMLLISSEDRLTIKSRDRILNILNRTYNKSLLADGMYEKDALTYNKTGDIESVLGDVALVDLSNGKRYIVAALVERPSNDGRAAELIQRISKRTYQEADEAIRPAVTPLGDPNAAGSDAVSPGAMSPSAVSPDATSSGAEEAGAANSLEVEPVIEEAPYPSANPRSQAESNIEPDTE